jgi:hypothetical protein
MTQIINIQNHQNPRNTNIAGFHLYVLSKIVKFIESRSGMVVAREWSGGRYEELLTNRQSFS